MENHIMGLELLGKSHSKHGDLLVLIVLGKLPHQLGTTAQPIKTRLICSACTKTRNTNPEQPGTPPEQHGTTRNSPEHLRNSTEHTGRARNSTEQPGTPPAQHGTARNTSRTARNTFGTARNTFGTVRNTAAVARTPPE